MLNFSTPMEPIADTMVELFDAIAGTLRWPGTPSPGTEGN
jgi:hypothetical protein